MDTRNASAAPSSRRRDRSNRRQYQSCDRCRKGRRGCDAVHLGIDPFGRSDLPTSKQVRRRGCSGCQRFNEACTFEWLRAIPRQVLPRRLNLARKLIPSEQRRIRDQLQAQPGLEAPFSSTGLSPSYNAQQHSERKDTEANFYDELDLDIGLDGLPLRGYGLALAVDPQDDSILRPTLSGQVMAESFFEATRDFVSPKPFDQSGFSKDQSHSVALTAESGDPAGWVQNNADYDQLFEPLWADEEHPSTQSDLVITVPTINEIQGTSLQGQNDLVEFGNYQNGLQDPDPFPGWLPDTTLASRRTASAQSSISRFATQHRQTISMQENRLADQSNKITISNNLMQIYCDSLENALECWIDRETCPYRIETDIGSLSHAVNEQTNSPSLSKTLYNRVVRLDAAFSRQRPRPLTRAEDAGSSKVLKLAIMAFACQWSHAASASSSTSVHETPWVLADGGHDLGARPTSDLEVPGAQDFEQLLRLSVWHEAQRCIRRWRHCGSFRVILASIILFCSQQPLDEEELDDYRENHSEPFASHDLGAGKSVHSSLGSFGDPLYRSTPSSDITVPFLVTHSIPDLAPFSSPFYGHEGLQHLEISLGHLVAWRRSIRSSHLHERQRTIRTAATEAPCNGSTLPESQHLSDFNLIFWLGVMCDTTSSVINRRAFIMPDMETLISPSNVTNLNFDSVATATSLGASHWRPDVEPQHPPPEELTQSVDIWGSYLLDADRNWRKSLVVAERLSTSQLRSKLIQQGVPLKVLFWRKVGQLQNMISFHEQQPTSSPTPTEIENAIKEALAVHQYWTANYAEFFTACTREHSSLSFQSQSWYLVLVLGWNMACLILARCIDFVDRNAMSERLGQSLRGSSVLTSELRKTSVYAISEAARVSSELPTITTTPPSSFPSELDPDATTKSSHPTLLGQTAIHSDPHTEKVVKALEIASEILLDWLRQWRSPAPSDCSLHLSWLYTNTSSDEIARRCVSCINTLDLLKSKSDAARLTTQHLMMRYRLLNVATS